MRAYRPDVTEQRKLYSLLLSLKRARGQKPIDPSPIKSNSEPWIAHPKSLADIIAVSESVEHSVDEIRPSWKLLNEMREAGDPFAEDLIREIDPPSQSRGIKP